MRSKRTLYNMVIAFVLQIVTLISGFILPRMIIQAFGSEANGLIASISQFLSYIALLEGGIGGVSRAVLYRPLAEGKIQEVSTILKETEQFFKFIGKIFIIYSLVLAFVFPYIGDTSFDYMYVFSLTLILSTSIFSQYYFGITYQVLLQAEQKNYVYSFFQIIIILLNLFISVALIKIGCNLQIVKLLSSLIFMLKPMLLTFYIKKNYNLVKDTSLKMNFLKDKWSGLGHHISYFVNSNVDIVLLTVFTNYKIVSVYSVYNMISIGLKNLISVATTGFEAVLGDMYAKKEFDTLEKTFNLYEVIILGLINILCGSSFVLIFPFIKIYTISFSDVNYMRVIFAYMILFLVAIYTIRMPYNSMVVAAGHFRQTMKGAFFEALVNIVISIVGVIIIGLEGVIFGTIVSTLLRTTQYAIYLSKHILYRPFKLYLKSLLFNMIGCGLIIYASVFFISSDINTYFQWIINAIKTFIISSVLNVILTIYFYNNEFKAIVFKIKTISNKKLRL